MMNVFAGHFMGLHLGAPAKKEEKNIFFVQTQNVLHIWWYDMLKWAKKTAIFLKISTGKIFSFSIAKRKLEPSAGFETKHKMYKYLKNMHDVMNVYLHARV